MLSTNYKKFQQYLSLHLQYTSLSTLFPIVSPSTHTRSISIENISPSSCVTTDSSSRSDILHEKIQSISQQFQEENNNQSERFDLFDRKFDKQHEELVIIRTKTTSVSDKTNKLQEKLKNMQNSKNKRRNCLQLSYTLKNEFIR